MSTSTLPMQNTLGLEPDETQRKAWNETLTRLDEQLAPLVSRTMLPRAEFERVIKLSEAVKSARQVLATL